jgi:hypothetical protein
MAKNFSNDRLANRVPNAVNELQKKQKAQSTDQIGFKGYIALPQRTGDPSGAPNGAMYYNSSSHEFKVKINGTWKVVTAT